MDMEIGVVCASCDLFNGIGTPVCGECGHVLALFPATPSRTERAAEVMAALSKSSPISEVFGQPLVDAPSNTLYDELRPRSQPGSQGRAKAVASASKPPGVLISEEPMDQ